MTSSMYPLYHMVKQSDALTLATLGILLVMSIVCWSIALIKLLMLQSHKHQLDHAIRDSKRIQRIEDIALVARSYANTMPGEVLTEYNSFLKGFLIRQEEWSLAQQRLDQIIDDVMQREESYLSVLSISAAVAPLLGLFGTVWGLIVSFLRISQQQSADIATVAPGIAEALITTLAGLVVAIPALVLYHYVQSKIRHIEHALITLGDTLQWVTYALVVQQK